MKKNFILLLVVFCLFFVCFPNEKLYVHAESVKENLEQEVNSQITDFDFSELDRILEKFGVDSQTMFGSESFSEKLQELIRGDYTTNSESILQTVINIMFQNILDVVPLLCSIVVIVIVCSFISQIRSSVGNKSVNDVVHFVCYAIVIIIVSKVVMDSINIANESIVLMKNQMEVIFPILLTLMTAVGNAVSASVYQPALALLTTIIMSVFTNVIMPLFVICFIFTIISNISNTVRFDKFVSFFNSLIKWIITFTFTIFFALMSIQGISAAGYDGITIRTAKFTLKSYIPLLGGYLSDGFDLILTSSLLIKNAVGTTGLLLIISTVILPIVKLVVLMFGFKLISAILEPITDKRISSFLYSVSKLMVLPIICIIGVAFMYILSVGLIICTGNIY